MVEQFGPHRSGRTASRHAEDRQPGALPAYLRIAEHLTIEIGTGRLSSGDRLPTERDLAARYGVSMMTLRKALAVVTERGLIARRQGSGNYVLGGAQTRRHLRALPAGGRAGWRRVAHGGAAGFDAPAQAATTWPISALPRTPSASAACADSTTSPSRWRRSGSTPFRPPQARASVGIALQDLCRPPRPHHHPGGGSGQRRAPARWAPKHCVFRPATTMGLVERRSFDQYGTPAEASRSWFDPATARATSHGCPEAPGRTRHMRYGIVGCGMMGQEHIRNIALLAQAEVSAFVEPDAGMAAATQALVPGATPCPDLGPGLLARNDVDALVIASPNHCTCRSFRTWPAPAPCPSSSKSRSPRAPRTTRPCAIWPATTPRRSGSRWNTATCPPSRASANWRKRPPAASRCSRSASTAFPSSRRSATGTASTATPAGRWSRNAAISST
jgi:GntR family transcriptional regulator